MLKSDRRHPQQEPPKKATGCCSAQIRTTLRAFHSQVPEAWSSPEDTVRPLNEATAFESTQMAEAKHGVSPAANAGKNAHSLPLPVP